MDVGDRAHLTVTITARRVGAAMPATVLFRVRPPTGDAQVLQAPDVDYDPDTGVADVALLLDEAGTWKLRAEGLAADDSPLTAVEASIVVEESQFG
jgi:hypothetical protein